MTEASPKQQLMIAKQQLDKLSIFIANLAEFFRGVSPAVDADLVTIKKLLSGKPDYEKAVELSFAINAQLKNQGKFLKQKNADSLKQIKHSLNDLSDLESLDPALKQEIKDFKQNLASEEKTPTSPLSYFETALSLFKKSLTNVAVANDSQSQHAQSQLHEQITRELKELIHPYYAKNSTDPTLKEIHQQLNAGLDHQALLECCLVMIRFVIKDLISESSAASKLISDIHKSLGKINIGIKSTIANSKKRLNKREQQKVAMKAQISEMQNAISSKDEITDIKQLSKSYLAKMQNSLQMSELEDRAEQDKVVALLQSMQKRVDELEQKADTYKTKLLQQRVNSLTDTLTKLPNRMAYEEKVKAAFKRVKQDNSSAFMAIFDIDHFKQINDKFGHSVGDKTLQIIATQLRKLLDSSDFLARWGGEEFVAILFDDSQALAMQKLEALRLKIAALPFVFKGTKVNITLSIGLSNFSAHQSIYSAFDEADKQLYRAKESGRNQTCTKDTK